jgi:hypothetical protein
MAAAECSPLGDAKERDVSDPGVMNAVMKGSPFGRTLFDP